MGRAPVLLWSLLLLRYVLPLPTGCERFENIKFAFFQPVSNETCLLKTCLWTVVRLLSVALLLTLKLVARKQTRSCKEEANERNVYVCLFVGNKHFLAASISDPAVATAASTIKPLGKCCIIKVWHIHVMLIINNRIEWQNVTFNRIFACLCACRCVWVCKCSVTSLLLQIPVPTVRVYLRLKC